MPAELRRWRPAWRSRRPSVSVSPSTSTSGARIGFEWRGLPFSWNTGGFDTAGGGKDEKFPDNRITDADRRFHFEQLLTLSYNIYLPTQFHVSE